MSRHRARYSSQLGSGKTLVEISRRIGPDRQVEQVRLAQTDRHLLGSKFPAVRLRLKRLAASTKRLAVGDVAQGAGNVEDVEILFKDLDVARQALKACWPRPPIMNRPVGASSTEVTITRRTSDSGTDRLQSGPMSRVIFMYRG